MANVDTGIGESVGNNRVDTDVLGCTYKVSQKK